MDKVFLRVNGNVMLNTEDAVDPGPPVVVVPPPVVHPPVGTYVGEGMWLPGHDRISTGQLTQTNPYVEGHFTIPTGWVGIVEFPVSGANLNLRVDGVLTSSDGRPMDPGPHVLRVEITSEAVSAEGSAAVAHTPQ